MRVRILALHSNLEASCGIGYTLAPAHGTDPTCQNPQWICTSLPCLVCTVRPIGWPASLGWFIEIVRPTTDRFETLQASLGAPEGVSHLSILNLKTEEDRPGTNLINPNLLAPYECFESSAVVGVPA